MTNIVYYLGGCFDLTKQAMDHVPPTILIFRMHSPDLEYSYRVPDRTIVTMTHDLYSTHSVPLSGKDRTFIAIYRETTRIPSVGSG